MTFFLVNCLIIVYISREPELKGRGITGGIRGPALPNELFWSEWQSLKDIISPELRDLFNRIFVLEPSLRMSLRDLIRHPWMTVIDGLSPEIVHAEMKQRCVLLRCIKYSTVTFESTCTCIHVS